MQRLHKILIIAAAYLAVALAAVNIALRFPGHTALILIVFAACTAVSALFLTLGMKYLGREHAARERERLSKIMHSLNAMVILWEDDFRYVEVNDELTKSIGYTSEDLADVKNLQKVLPPDAFAPSLQAIVNNRDEEFYVTAKGGAKVCTIWNTSIMSTVQSKTRTTCLMMSIGMDISETVRMKEDLIRYSKDLAESESRYSLSMELSEIGIVLKKANKNTFYVSEQLCKKLGIEKGDDIPAEALRELFHEDDKKVFDALAASMTSLRGYDNNEIHHSEFRVLEADGQYHWFDFRYKVTPNADINFANIGGAVIDVTQDKAKDTLIEKMAYIDDVTQIFNRNKFMQIGQETFECAAESGSGISYWVIVLDIDNFHLVNDTCGYESGNRLLNEFGKIVDKSLTEGGIGARIGGDNFALLIHDIGDDELPINIVKGIQENLKVFCDESFAAQGVTCSAGYCKMSDGGSDFAQVLDHAEFSLSMSDGTKNDIIRYDNKIHDKIIESNAIEAELAKAIENNELALYYQPKIDLADGTLMGMEALIRWIKPDGTVIPPSQFIPVAEHSLLITKISDFVLHEACRQNKAWQDKGYPPIAVSINLTAVDFYQTDVKEAIQKALDETGLEPQWLDVELTESLALKDIDHAIQQMQEIRDLGVQLSMDDFGTGYSSLSYIQVLPITLLKLDRSFIMYLEEDEISREIVSAVIRIAKSKKIETIAEGIETVGQAEILKQSGCDLAQGYFFGKPMPVDRFEEFMAEKAREHAEKVSANA
ncbi:MAG: EAL domain-containing protein [Ruminococcus sp.]|nr:EAL domain-containing protein [Ruminococcus sp.]MCM1380533.1 EAL domain-containing protein [Muribaculaceae bacterium]MCM1479126.1 EAL domain-containing protein [Muribaculaceae bacterium]